MDVTCCLSLYATLFVYRPDLAPCENPTLCLARKNESNAETLRNSSKSTAMSYLRKFERMVPPSPGETVMILAFKPAASKTARLLSVHKIVKTASLRCSISAFIAGRVRMDSPMLHSWMKRILSPSSCCLFLTNNPSRKHSGVPMMRSMNLMSLTMLHRFKRAYLRVCKPC